MADLVITAASVNPIGSTAQTKLVQAGEAIAQGEAVYLNSTDSKHYKADADLSEAAAKAVGVALTPSAMNGYFVVQIGGSINLGATLTKGELYVVSATGGAIAPFGDLVAGDWITFLGVASSASELIL